MSMETDRPQSLQGFEWQKINDRAEAAEQMIRAVFRLLDAHEDDEAERLLDIISDRIHSEGPR